MSSKYRSFKEFSARERNLYVRRLAYVIVDVCLGRLVLPVVELQ